MNVYLLVPLIRTIWHYMLLMLGWIVFCHQQIIIILEELPVKERRPLFKAGLIVGLTYFRLLHIIILHL